MVHCVTLWCRGVANGIFSWGVYFGYGMAYIFGGRRGGRAEPQKLLQ